MKNYIIGFATMIIFIFLPFSCLNAAPCDRDFNKGHDLMALGRLAGEKKDYDSAITCYQQAATLFQHIASTGCWSPKIEQAVPSLIIECGCHVDYYRRLAEKKQNYNYNQEQALFEKYSQAADCYKKGDKLALEKQYKQALPHFEKAVTIWKQIAAHSQSKYCKQAEYRAANATKKIQWIKKNLALNDDTKALKPKAPKQKTHSVLPYKVNRDGSILIGE